MENNMIDWHAWKSFIPQWDISPNNTDNAKIISQEIKIAGLRADDPPEKIRYRSLGNGKKIIFFVPGNNTTGAAYVELMQEFAALPEFLTEYTIIVPDYRGSGESTYHQPITSLRDFAHDFDQLLSSYLAERGWSARQSVNLVGYSMGFGVALEMMMINPSRYGDLVGLTGIGTRGYRLKFNAQSAGFDGTKTWQPGDYVPNHEDQIGLAAAAFNQRAWQGPQRTVLSVKMLWDMTVFNDVLQYHLGTLTPTHFEFTFSPTYSAILREEFNIKFMPNSIYGCHKFNISDHNDGEHINGDGHKVIRAGDGRLSKNPAIWRGKNILLVKAKTDYANWRGDLVITDESFAHSREDLHEVGAVVTSVMIAPGQGYDHGFPLAKPSATASLIHHYFGTPSMSAHNISRALVGAKFELDSR
ncbi:MAG: alpha/beta hydrolase [Candidatus Symbiobacter sp.]|nr:alpha/beta hydrolase [Candidatus Symbiobacter sp.]